MMLCLREGRNDPQGLERVLPVLDRRLYDGGDGGVVFHASLRAEASTDLEFGLGRAQGLLAVVVRGRDGKVREEGEDVAPMFVNALLEFIQFCLLAVFPCVDGRPGEQFVQASPHLRPHIPPDVPLMPLVDGVPQDRYRLLTKIYLIAGEGGRIPTSSGTIWPSARPAIRCLL